jgi:hypothetical protein
MDLGYCRDIPFSKAVEQHDALRQHGVREQKIYIEGRDAESFEACLRALRPGDRILLASDLRILGDKRAAITERVSQVTRLHGIVVDIATGECSDRDGVAMLDRAAKGLHGSAKLRSSRKHAKRIGRRGGHAKGEAMFARRFGNIDFETAQRVWTMPGATIEAKLHALGPKFTEATCRRMFGPSRQHIRK